jgi:patatin-like phospholipase/acyl hydrolase
MDPPLSDVCIATSAAPCYFPPHLLTASAKEFHLVDGGVAANNPVSCYNPIEKRHLCWIRHVSTESHIV